MTEWRGSVRGVPGPMSTRCATREAGSALVAAIGLSAVIALMAAVVVRMLVHTAILTDAAERGMERDAAIEAVAMIALSQLVDAEGPLAWGHNHVVSWQGQDYNVTWWSPDGQVDLNAAPPAILSAAFRAANAERPDRLASAVIDWRDLDDLVSVNGAEAGEYVRADLPLPANRPFEHEAELSRVLGVSEALAACMRAYVTVSSWREAPVAELAPVRLRDALAMAGNPSEPAELTILNEAGTLIGLRIEAEDDVTGAPVHELRLRLSGQSTNPLLVQAVDKVGPVMCEREG